MLSTDFWNGLNGVDPLVRRFNPFNPLPESVDSILIKKPSTHLKHTHMRFWLALLRAFLHSIATLIATISVWAIWSGWFVFINGHHDVEWGGPWGTYRFAMHIALIIALILCGGFLIMSLIYHFFAANISKRRHILSSLTLALSSLILWLALPEGGMPLIALLIGLPIMATLWMIGSTGRAQET